MKEITFREVKFKKGEPTPVEDADLVAKLSALDFFTEEQADDQNVS